MAGHIIDFTRLAIRKAIYGFPENWLPDIYLLQTDYGTIRIRDTKGNKPVIISAPDGPNVIEHHEELINQLANDFRIICIELPGLGFSYPSYSYDFSASMTKKVIINILDILKIDRASLSFSCSNGYHAIAVAQAAPDRINHLFLSQTPSIHQMKEWVNKTIPKTLAIPAIGQIINSFMEKRFANRWYKYALPKGSDTSAYQKKALNAIKTGGCFCLSGLVQGLTMENLSSLKSLTTPSTLIWGNKDFTHRQTDFNSIKEHIPNCRVIEFNNCGHFPELENSKDFVKLVREVLNS